MGIFNLFKKQSVHKEPAPASEYIGPVCLEGYTIPIQNAKDKAGQWQANLISPDGNTRITITDSSGKSTELLSEELA